MDNTITVNINNLTRKERNQPISKSKKKRKFRAMTNGEFCLKWVKIHIFCCTGEDNCPFCGVDCSRRDFKKKPFKTKDGKYIFIEVKE